MPHDLTVDALIDILKALEPDSKVVLYDGEWGSFDQPNIWRDKDGDVVFSACSPRVADAATPLHVA